jgi:DNA-directed RNA polymerase specialized sigma24 family protein/transposase
VEVLEGARRHPFCGEVLGDDKILCLECGVRLSVLGGHLGRFHRMTGAAYKLRWGYDRRQPLASKRWVERVRAASQGREVRMLEKRGRPPKGYQWKARQQDMERRRWWGRQGVKRRKISVQQVVKLFRQGYNGPQVAALLGCSASVVRARLRSVGLAFRRPRKTTHVTRAAIEALRKKGLGWREVAWKLQCSVSFAQKLVKRTGGPPPALPPLRPDITREAILREAARGRTMREVAKDFKTSPETIRSRLKDILPPEPDRPPQTSNPAWRGDIDASRVAEMRGQGWTLEAIAGELGCSCETVRRRLIVANQKPVRLTRRLSISNDALAKARQEGLTLAQMAARFECSANTITERLHEVGLIGRRPPRPGRADITVESVVDARQAGLTLQQIADQLHCSVKAVRARLKTARQRGIDIF